MPWNDRIKRRLKLRDLDIVMAVIEAGTMGKAADNLNMSQPAVSKAIADLERTLGVPLLDRSRRGVEPTQYGRALAKRGVVVFDELRQSVQDIDFLADPTGGELRIGSTDFVAAGTVSVVIDRLSRQYPRIGFHVASGTAATLLRELTERNIELVIGRMYRMDDEEIMDVEVLYDDPLVVVADKQNPLSRRRTIKLGQLVDEPWALPPADTPSGSFMQDFFRRNGLGIPHITVRTYSFPLRHCLVATGRFLTVLPRSTLRVVGSGLSLKALPIDLSKQRSAVIIVTLKNRTLSPMAQLFIDSARAVAKEMIKAN
jgi:DNA-binding transcriptional LysR family regulator